MPTYEYACTACGHGLEAVQRFTDEPLTECPECGGALRKVYGAVGIVLKGSGFYKTDSRASAGNGSGPKSGADASSSSSSGEGSGSEPGAKKESATKESAKTGNGDSGSGGSSKESKPAAAAAG